MQRTIWSFLRSTNCNVVTATAYRPRNHPLHTMIATSASRVVFEAYFWPFYTSALVTIRQTQFGLLFPSISLLSNSTPRIEEIYPFSLFLRPRHVFYVASSSRVEKSITCCLKPLSTAPSAESRVLVNRILSDSNCCIEVAIPSIICRNAL